MKIPGIELRALGLAVSTFPRSAISRAFLIILVHSNPIVLSVVIMCFCLCSHLHECCVCVLVEHWESERLTSSFGTCSPFGPQSLIMPSFFTHLFESQHWHLNIILHSTSSVVYKWIFTLTLFLLSGSHSGGATFLRLLKVLSPSSLCLWAHHQ